MEKMTVAVSKTTGHVLGALTRVADPEGTLEPADLVGEGLPLRHPATGEAWLTLDPRDLAVEVVDLVEEALIEPAIYRVDNGVATRQAVLEPAVPPERVSLTLTEIRVELPMPVAEPVKAWVQIEGGPNGERLTREVTIPAAPLAPVGTESLLLASGQYQTLALVPDYGANFKRWIL